MCFLKHIEVNEKHFEVKKILRQCGHHADVKKLNV